MKVNIKSEIPEGFDTRITKDAKTDTLYYWYKPKLEADSLVLNISHPNFDKDYTVKIRKQNKDSLTIAGNPAGTIGIEQPFKIYGSIPFVSFDASKVNLIDKDSAKVSFTTEFDSINNAYAFNFKKTDENNYLQIIYVF